MAKTLEAEKKQRAVLWWQGMSKAWGQDDVNSIWQKEKELHTMGRAPGAPSTGLLEKWSFSFS